MNWIAGKLTKPAFNKAFGYMQETYPDSHLTQHVASLATSDNPMAPSEDAPFAVVDKNASALNIDVANASGGRSIRARATGAVQNRAKTYAFNKFINTVWGQVTLPLTIFLWAIKLLVSFFEHRQLQSALQFKSDAAHKADVERCVKAIQARSGGKLLASKRWASQGHMLRSNDAKKEMGPAAAMANQGTAAHQLHLVDLSRLNKVLSLDTSSDTCVVEAGCTFRDLLRVTTHSHLMPQVVPPFLSMTVGGAVSGSAFGATSWKKGSFLDGVLEMEVALASGEVVTATREGAHAALFHAMHSSYHSIGTILSLKLQLVHAPRYMWMKYENFNRLDKATTRLNELLQAPNVQSVETLEAFVFNPQNVTICMSQGLESIDTRKHKVVTMSYWWERQYAYYVLALSQKAQERGGSTPVKHCIPLMDYLGRFEHGAFWQGSWMYAMLPWPLKGNSFVTRLLAGWTMDESNIRGAIENSDRHSDFERTRLLQDAQVPLHHLGPFLHWTLDATKILPLWLCPVLGSPSDILAPNYVHAGSANNSAHGFHYVNVGVYGRIDSQAQTCEDINTQFVQQTYEAGGRTMLYAHNWHTPDLWSKMVDRKAYDAVRKKYGAEEAFPHVYDKIAMRETDRAELRTGLTPAEEHHMQYAMMSEIVTRKAKFWQA